MANPRATLDHSGIGAVNVTFDADNSTILYDDTKPNGSAQVGLAVTLSDDSTVALAADAEAIVGKLIKVEADLKCVVQVAGYMTLPAGTAAGVTLGKKIVGDLLVAAKGYVREVAASDAELAVARGFIVDNDTATAIGVYLL